MEPNPGIAVPHDPMNEMYDFFAFDEALQNGLSVNALIEEQAKLGREQLENRVNELTSQLNALIAVNEREREELVGEAKDLAPRAAQIYCHQLSERLQELKQTASKQKEESNLAEKTIREQKEQNGSLVDDMTKLRAFIRRQHDNHSHLQSQVYKAGNGLCQYIASPK